MGRYWYCVHFLLPVFISPEPQPVDGATMGRSQGPNTGTAKARNIQMLSRAWRQKPKRCLRIGKAKDWDLSRLIVAMRRWKVIANAEQPCPAADLRAGYIHPPEGQQTSGLTRPSFSGLGTIDFTGRFLTFRRFGAGKLDNEAGLRNVTSLSVHNGRVTTSYLEASRRIKVKI